MVSRSWPSLSQSSLVPTTTIADVGGGGGGDGAVHAGRRVRGGGSRSCTPRRMPMPRGRVVLGRRGSTGPSGDEVEGRPRAPRCPCRRTRCPGPGGSATPSNTTSPPMLTRAPPRICTNVNSCGPVSSGVYTPVTRNDSGGASKPSAMSPTTIDPAVGRCTRDDTGSPSQVVTVELLEQRGRADRREW